MKQIIDLHIHSKYSRACSPLLVLENIDKFCRVKGVDIVATGDFTYPKWADEISEKLIEIDKSGLYKIKDKHRINDGEFGDIIDSKGSTKFILSTELALVYKKENKTRRLHIVVLAPNLYSIKKLNKYLDKRYNVRSDGRPILGMSAEELCEVCFGIDKNFMIIPAHAWTPWFAVFGSKSGFNSLKECFGKWTTKIYAIETGLSSDPEMNWSLSGLDNITLLSNSDAHSLSNLGREANIFDLKKISYLEIINIIKNVGSNKFLKTIEFYPEEGMYHYDGHRDCSIVFDPVNTKKHKNICPICNKELVIGVMNRVASLADRKIGYKPKKLVPFLKTVGLEKIIAESIGVKSRNSKKVQVEYREIISSGFSEFEILLDLSYKDLRKIAPPKVVDGIKRVREGNLTIEPGFDGRYGSVKIF